MKKADTWMQIIKEDGTRLTPVIRNTEEGQSRYANRAYNKYGEQACITKCWTFCRLWHGQPTTMLKCFACLNFTQAPIPRSTPTIKKQGNITQSWSTIWIKQHGFAIFSILMPYKTEVMMRYVKAGLND